MSNKKIKIVKDGPYIIPGDIPLEKEFVVPDNNNDPLSWKKGEKYQKILLHRHWLSIA